MQKEYARIERSVYGLGDRDYLALWLTLKYESLGDGTVLGLFDPKDVKALLMGTRVKEVSALEGKVVEAFLTERRRVMGISINEYLV